jgi:Homeobox KN domain
MNPGLTSVITSGDKAFNFEERNSSARIRHRLQSKEMSDAKDDLDISSDEDDDRGGKGSGKSRRELPSGAVSTLKAWLLSPEHFTHPYPTPQDQVMLMQKTGIDKKQLKNWFTNARRRIWKPMLKKQLEQGTLTATGSGGNGVAVPGVVPGLMVHVTAPVNAHSHTSQDIDNLHSVQAIQVHYQKAVQQHSQQPQTQQQQVSCLSHRIENIYPFIHPIILWELPLVRSFWSCLHYCSASVNAAHSASSIFSS